MEVFNYPAAFSNLSHERFDTSLDQECLDSLLSCGPADVPQWEPVTPPESLGSDVSSTTEDGGFLRGLGMTGPAVKVSMPKLSPVPIPQFELGDDYKFSVDARGRELHTKDSMHFVRKGSCFQLAVNFSKYIGWEETLYVRITPSWDLGRSDSATVIYCCGKHAEPVPDQLEQFSMLRVSGVQCSYELDEETRRLSVVVPMEKKVRGMPFFIPVESKCFSTCGSNQKKPYHVISVTLERIDASGRSVIGRKILNMKFSSSPYRDLRNFAQKTDRQPVHKPILLSGKRASSPDSSQLVMVPVQKKHIETVQLFLRTLERAYDDDKHDTASHRESPAVSADQQNYTNQDDRELDLYEWLSRPDTDLYEDSIPSVGAPITINR